MRIWQWSFRKTGTIGTLARRAKRCLTWSTEGFSVGSQDITPRKILRLLCKIPQSNAFWPENVLQCRPYCILRHFSNAIPSCTPVICTSIFQWLIGNAIICFYRWNMFTVINLYCCLDLLLHLLKVGCICKMLKPFRSSGFSRGFTMS